MSDSEAFQVNAPHVIFENIEGELVLIHMAKGSYYSTDAIGAQLWDLIVTGHSPDEIRVWMGSSYRGDAAEIARGIEGFLSELQAEELIVRTERPLRNGPPRASIPSGGTFAAPVLNKYRDMEDMLMIDPIHEVEETGWPAPKPADAGDTTTSWPAARAAQSPRPRQAPSTD